VTKPEVGIHIWIAGIKAECSLSTAQPVPVSAELNAIIAKGAVILVIYMHGTHLLQFHSHARDIQQAHVAHSQFLCTRRLSKAFCWFKERSAQAPCFSFELRSGAIGRFLSHIVQQL
jgi:hypothetical protein